MGRFDADDYVTEDDVIRSAWGRIRLDWQRMVLELDKSMMDAPKYMNHIEAVAWAEGYQTALHEMGKKINVK